MEYRKTVSGAFIRCPCGEEIKGGELAWVPVSQEENRLVFHLAICDKCYLEKTKDQDGSFHPDPVAQKGTEASMYSKDIKKDLCSSGHFFSGSMDSCHGCGMDLKEAVDDEVIA